MTDLTGNLDEILPDPMPPTVLVPPGGDEAFEITRDGDQWHATFRWSRDDDRLSGTGTGPTIEAACRAALLAADQAFMTALEKRHPRPPGQGTMSA